MDKFELQKLRELPIEGVAERLGMSVSRHKCLCPFHNDRHPSLSFSVKKNMYRCFVCGAKGGTIDLVMGYLNKDFKEACRWLADEAGVTVFRPPQPLLTQEGKAAQFDVTRYERYFERPWLNEEARKFLYEERRIDPRVVRWCRLTSWKDRQGVPWLQTPYYDLLNLLRPGDSLFITEGCSDCWSLLSAGYKSIAIPSATVLTKKDAELLQTLSSERSIRFEMWPDRDLPGERLFLQLQQILPGLVHHQLPPGCKDFSDYYLTKISQQGQSPL